MNQVFVIQSKKGNMFVTLPNKVTSNYEEATTFNTIGDAMKTIVKLHDLFGSTLFKVSSYWTAVSLVEA